MNRSVFIVGLIIAGVVHVWALLPAMKLALKPTPSKQEVVALSVREIPEEPKRKLEPVHQVSEPKTRAPEPPPPEAAPEPPPPEAAPEPPAPEAAPEPPAPEAAPEPPAPEAAPEPPAPKVAPQPPPPPEAAPKPVKLQRQELKQTALARAEQNYREFEQAQQRLRQLQKSEQQAQDLISKSVTQVESEPPLAQLVKAAKVDLPSGGVFRSNADYTLQPVARIAWGNPEEAMRTIDTGRMAMVIVDANGRVTGSLQYKGGHWQRDIVPQSMGAYSNQVRVVDHTGAFAGFAGLIHEQEHLAVLVPVGLEKRIQRAMDSSGRSNGLARHEVAACYGRLISDPSGLDFQIERVERRNTQ